MSDRQAEPATGSKVSNDLMSLLAIFRHEWRQLTGAAPTYIFQIGFLACLMACIFLVADFYSTDEASIRLMLTFLPWVALIFVPALAMRAWSDEPGGSGMELTQTLPAADWAVIAGKFLAGSAILLITLLFTLPFGLTVAYLGEPDGGVMFAGYLAAALLLMTAYAVGLSSAVLMREPVASYIVGIGVLFALLLLGWDILTRLLDGQVPAPLLTNLASASPKYWFDRIAKGLVEPAAVGYFVALSLFALWAAAFVLEIRRGGSREGRWTAAALAKSWALPITLFLVTPLLRSLPLALDLTSEREFTLNSGTLRVIDAVPPGTEVTFYWSENETSVPARIKSHAGRVRDHLRTLAVRAGGRLNILTRNPEPDSDTEFEALAAGLRKIPMTSGDSFFLGATFRHGNRTSLIPYFDIRRDRFVEYDIALMLSGLTKTRTSKIGFLSPLLRPRHVTEEREGLSFLSEVKRAYDVSVIPHFSSTLPNDLDVLILIDATILRRELLYEIDQFVMRGGSLIVMMDPKVRFNRPSDAINPEPSNEINDISDILLRYGIRYQGDAVVGDDGSASLVTDSAQRQIRYPYWLRLKKDRLSDAHSVTAELNEVFFGEPGALNIEAAANALPLVVTSSKSGKETRKAFQNANAETLASGFKPDGEERVLAAMLKGPFKSAFNDDSNLAGKAGHTRNSQGTPTLFVFADVDWIFDGFSLQRVPLENDTIVRPLNDNLAFLLNIIEYASGSPDLISIRSRGKLNRPFTYVESLFARAQSDYREQEQALVQKIAATEKMLAEIPGAAGVSRADQLPEPVQSKIRKLRKDLLPFRRKLREIRRRSRQDVVRLGHRLTIINLISGPVLVLIFAGLMTVVFRVRPA
ncbi:MAG: Gldg family protein [Methyloligellaceae bacterium]